MASSPHLDRVCVIGAGISGLTTLKHILQYGLEVVCYEKGKHIGGLWRYDTGSREGFGSVIRSTFLNTSKEFVTLSDFPMKNDSAANFMHNAEVYSYFQDYCNHFDLERHIQFDTEVLQVTKAKDYDETGAWIVTTQQCGETSSSEFSAVVVCNGHHVKPFTPTLKGIDNFTGRILHSHDYTDPSALMNQRVLVVGFGNSGGDIACELARLTKKVVVSTRHGTWVNRRVVHKGYPRDVLLRNRLYEKALGALPGWFRAQLALSDYGSFLDHDFYGLRPVENPGQSPVLLADDLPLYLSSGMIRIKPGIERFTSDGVIFNNGHCEEFDAVIFCTGYSFDFNFIEGGDVIPTKDNQVDLWQRIFPPTLKWNTLAVVGLVDPLGPTITVSEMQGRAVAHIWTKNISLPTNNQMQKEVQVAKIATANRFKCSARKASLQVDYIWYMDQLAELIGCGVPCNWSLILRDPKLAFLLYAGPVSATHYRLSGPGPYPSARQHILDTFYRVYKAMQADRKISRGIIPYSDLLSSTPLLINWFLFGFMLSFVTTLIFNLVHFKTL